MRWNWSLGLWKRIFAANYQQSIRRHVADRSRLFRPRLEALEDRFAPAISVTGPTNVGWVALQTANNNSYDFAIDEQATSPEGDIVGTAANPGFYMQFDDAGTASLTDGTIGFRIRVGGDTGPGGFNQNLFIGMDGNSDGMLDLFLGVRVQSGTTTLAVWDAGSGANSSPSTTSISNTPVSSVTATSSDFNFSIVNTTIDPTVTSTDVDARGDTDFFLTFTFSFSSLVGAFASAGVDISGVNENSAMRFVLATATQDNSLNQDLGGVNGGVNSAQTWDQLGGFSQTVQLNGVFPNQNPTAVNDSLSTSEDNAVTLDVLANDSDADLDSLTITEINGTAIAVGGTAAVTGGTVTLNANGTMGFAPTANFNGPVSFTYTIADGNGGTASATVSGTVTAVNDPPVDANETISTGEDTATSGNVLTNATDIEGTATTVTQFTIAGDATVYPAGTTATIPGVGTLVINSNGTFTFTPAGNYNGPVPVATYTVSDGNATDTSTLTLSVTAAADFPVDGNETITTAEDTPSTGNVLANATDADGDTPTVTQFTVAGDATIYPAGSTATIVGVGTLIIGANGTFTFTPASNYNGPGPVATYTVSDGNTGTDTSTLTLSVSAANDPPVDGNESITTAEDTPSSGNVLANAVDVDGNTLVVSQFTVAGDATVYPAGSAAAITGVGSLIINANGTFTFTPDGNYNGSVPVATYIVSDGATGTDTSTLTVSITASNDVPVDGNESVTTLEDTPGTGNVLANANDADGNTVSVTQFTMAGDATVYPAGTTATLAGVGTLIINANGAFTFTPASNFSGPVPVATYTVSDGNSGTDTSTLTINVTADNSPPQDSDESIVTGEDTAATNNVLANAIDTDNDTLSVTQFTIAGDPTVYPAGATATLPGVGTLILNTDGGFTFTPVGNYNGPVPVATYTVSDGNGGTDTSTLTLSVSAANDAPVDGNETIVTAEDTASTGNVLTNATDADGNTPVVTQFIIAGDATVYPAGTTATLPGVGTLVINADGTFTFTPAANYNGPVPAATYTVSDGNGGTDTSTLTLSVTATNDPPVDGNEAVVTQEDVVATGNVLANATDPESNTLSVTQFIVAGTATVFPAGNIATLAGVGTLIINASGAFTFAPATNYNGPVPVVTYTISDGNGGTDTSTLTLSVSSANDVPVDGDESIVTDEGVTATGNVLANASDGDGNTLVVTQFTLTGDAAVYTPGSTATIVGVGTLLINADGSFTFTPEPNYNGAVPVSTYTLSDGNGGIDTSSLTLTISAATLGRITGFIYQDLNNNGLRDANEPAISGVQVTLEGTTAAGPIVPLTMFVDSNGVYDFPNLEPGTYQVRQVAQPAGFVDGRDTRGNVTPLAGSAGADVIASVVVTAGVTATNNNFGEVSSSSLAGQVWVDANRNRIRDPQELVRAGVKVVLTGRDDLGRRVRQVAVTDSQGLYQFANLRPGIYSIDLVLPRGFKKAFAIYGSQGGPRAFTNGRPLSGIVLAQGVAGVGNNLGLLAVASKRNLLGR